MRPIFAVLIALAMLFAPLAMQGAMAAAPSDHHAQSMDMTHCSSQSEDGKLDQTVDQSCCAAMCAGMALAPATTGDLAIRERAPDLPATEQFGRGFVAKLATPPPRIA